MAVWEIAHALFLVGSGAGWQALCLVDWLDDTLPPKNPEGEQNQIDVFSLSNT